MPTQEHESDPFKAERLETIAQMIGFTLWQIQELEGVAAQYVVLATNSGRGMGQSAGPAPLDAAQLQTFGSTVMALKKVGLLDDRLTSHFEKMRDERNWMVHYSRRTSRSAIHSDDAAQQLAGRLDAIASEALSLMRELGALCERLVISRGVSRQFIDDQADILLKRWHESDL